MRFSRLHAPALSVLLAIVLLAGVSDAHAAGGLLYASQPPLVIDVPTKRVELHATSNARGTATQHGCERVTLLLTGIRAPSVDATGVRVSIGKVRLGMFSLYGLEAGVPRTLSFDIPQLPVFAAPPKTVALTMELIGHRRGSVTVESVKIWCESADPPGR